MGTKVPKATKAPKTKGMGMGMGTKVPKATKAPKTRGMGMGMGTKVPKATKAPKTTGMGYLQNAHLTTALGGSMNPKSLKKSTQGKPKSDRTSADAGAVDKIGIGGTVIVVAVGTVVLIAVVLAISWFKKQLATRANHNQDIVIIDPSSDPVERSTI